MDFLGHERHLHCLGLTVSTNNQSPPLLRRDIFSLFSSPPSLKSTTAMEMDCPHPPCTRRSVLNRPSAMPACSRVFDVSGCAAPVTGGARGIGAAIAAALAEAGVRVVVNQRRQPGETNAAGGCAVCVRADIGEPSAHQQARVNWQIAFGLIQRAAPGRLASGWGQILTVGSVQEAKPHPEIALAKQFASCGVTVNNPSSGVIDTPRFRPRIGDPAECAGAAGTSGMRLPWSARNGVCRGAIRHCELFRRRRPRSGKP